MPSVFLCPTIEQAADLVDAGYRAAYLPSGFGGWTSNQAGRFADADEVLCCLTNNPQDVADCERIAVDLTTANGSVVVRLLIPPQGMRSWREWMDGEDGQAADSSERFMDIVDATPAWRLRRTRFRLWSGAELMALPAPEWLWDGLLPAGAMSALVGQPGAGKSFVALDLACSVAAGVSCLGRPVQPGAVLYVAAEGTAGLPQRYAAWHAARGLPFHRTKALRFVTEGVNLFAADDHVDLIGAAQELAEEHGPVGLIVLDTLARIMAGGEENSAKDVGLVIERAERLRRATGAHVGVVHHMAKHSESERGSTALRGAMDTVLFLIADESNSGVRVLRADKQKDAEPLEPIGFTLEAAGGSCAPLVSAASWTETPDDGYSLTQAQFDALKLLRDCFGNVGASSGDWREVFEKSKRTFFRAMTVLTERGCVGANTQERPHRYYVTPEGHRRLKLSRPAMAPDVALSAKTVAPPMAPADTSGLPDGTNAGTTPGTRDASRALSRAFDLDRSQPGAKSNVAPGKGLQRSMPSESSVSASAMTQRGTNGTKSGTNAVALGTAPNGTRPHGTNGVSSYGQPGAPDPSRLRFTPRDIGDAEYPG